MRLFYKLKRKLRIPFLIISVIVIGAVISGYFSTEQFGPYQVVSVIDGDTIVCNISNAPTTVRLIGVNTPESVHPDPTKNTAEGVIASQFTKSVLVGKSVYLGYDIDKSDDYGRTLAYVYVDGTMFNETLIEQGYAKIMIVPPNVKHAIKLLVD